MISVIIAARDAAATIGRTLAAVNAQEAPEPVEIVVVDDASADATAALAEAAGAQVVQLSHPEGPGGARNHGVAAARGEVLAFTDADCFPRPGWLAEGRAALGSTGLVQGAVIADTTASPGPFDRTVWVGGETGLYETANLMLRREPFERVGGFETLLEAEVGKPLAEDLWLGWRIRRSGAGTTFCATAVVEHAVFPRSALGYVAEHRRVRHFPAIAREVPELRRALFFGRVFLSPRTAVADLAAAGALAALVRRSPRPLIAVAPWLVTTLAAARHWRGQAPKVALAHALADGVSLFELVRASLKSRTPVL